ncbi:DnaB family ATPase, partial [Arthrospira platensis SPKY2]
YISSMISDRLNYCFLYLYKDILLDQFNKLETNDFVHLKGLKNNIMDIVTKLIADIRKAENLEKANMDFSLEETVFEAIVEKTVKDLQNPSCNLKCGIQALNEMIGGAFESGRFYMFLGVSGGFKSGILLNLLYHFKMNNMAFRTKDPSKKPAILLYTQENTVEETVNRLFSLAVSEDSDDKMKNYTPKEAIRLLKEKGKLIVNQINNINIIIKYAKTKTKTTQDLYYVLDDLEDQGYEVIALIHDYIKRLKSTEGHSEVRHELGAIVDELKALAIEKNIPVISASQLNKESARVIDEGIQCNKSDLARLLGRSQVGRRFADVKLF